MAAQFRRVVVWSGRLRAAHWLIAAASLWLIGTGWLIAHSPALAQAASDYHSLGAGVLLVSLLLRLYLGFFGRDAERFEHLLPVRSEMSAIRASLIFYLSLGRAPMPNWFAHNPLWKPLYLVLLIALLLITVNGWLMPDYPLLGRVYLPTLHDWLSNLIIAMTVLHLLAVLLQDVRGRSAGISAMLNGERYFDVDRDSLVRPDIPEVSISPDDIRRR